MKKIIFNFLKVELKLKIKFMLEKRFEQFKMHTHSIDCDMNFILNYEN